MDRRLAALVGAVLAATLADAALGGDGGADLVEGGALALALAEDATEALHVLADAAVAGEDDADVGVGDVDALVEHLAGEQDRELAGGEGLEQLGALGGLGLVGDDGEQEQAREAVDGVVVLGEDEDAVAAVAGQDAPQGR